ncbi:MAG TPA: hypothetical protein VG758_29520 [Hyphomicrobiaceae bacterium]|nr:hypothetical protein [Hyphomicrobiaceae bacterium]
MLVPLDPIEQPRHAALGCRILHLGDHVGISPPRADELVVEGVEIDFLFAFGCRVIVGRARAGFILDEYSEEPALSGLDRCDFEAADRGDLAQVLAFLVAEVHLSTHGNFAHVRAAPCYRADC